MGRVCLPPALKCSCPWGRVQGTAASSLAVGNGMQRAAPWGAGTGAGGGQMELGAPPGHRQGLLSPHFQDVLDDLLLIVETCLEILHVELEEVQRRGACKQGEPGSHAQPARRPGSIPLGTPPPPAPGAVLRHRGENPGVWAPHQGAGGHRHPPRPHRAAPACWRSGRRC